MCAAGLARISGGRLGPLNAAAISRGPQFCALRTPTPIGDASAMRDKGTIRSFQGFVSMQRRWKQPLQR